MKRTYIHIIVLMLLAAGAAPLFAQEDGKTCETAIPVGRDYQGRVQQAGTIWYRANTFDLPLTLYYRPDGGEKAPEIWMDFSCTPGVYEDSVICSLFCKDNQVYRETPISVTPQKGEDEQGRLVYYVAMGKFYRDMLLAAGMKNDVDVFVKVNFFDSGDIAMAPDNTFANCMDNGTYFRAGDTVHVLPNDVERYYIVPYARWKNDSVRYTWTGDKPVDIVFGSTCIYDPLDAEDEKRVDVQTIKAHDTLRISNAEINHYIDYVENDGGLFFLKALSESAGTLKVEYIPAPAPKGNATVIQYNQPNIIPADSAKKVYAISNTWKGDVLFQVETNHLFTMYIGTTPDFTPSTAISSVSFQIENDGEGRRYGITETELKALFDQSSDYYVYVRFECSILTTLLPTQWERSECEKNTTVIVANKNFDVSRNSPVQYRLYYKDWKGGDMTFNWASSSGRNNYIYFGDTCSFAASEGGHVYRSIKHEKVASVVISKDQLNQWESKVDDEGYLNVRLYPAYQGVMKVTTNRPAEQDPKYPNVTLQVRCAEGENTINILSALEQDVELTEANGSVIWNKHMTKTESYSMTLDNTDYVLSGKTDTIDLKRPYIEQTEEPISGMVSCIASAPTLVNKPSRMRVQSATNYIKIIEEYEPLIISYISDSAFGPIPSIIIDDDIELPAKIVFQGCQQKWQWEISDQKLHTAAIIAHEDATVQFAPTMCKDMTIEETIKICGGVDWQGERHEASGVYKKSYTSQYGCDSTHILHLTVYPIPENIETTETVWDSLILDDVTYTESGEYTIEKTDANGCNFIHTLHLTIHKTTYDSILLKGCDTVEYNGTIFMEDGTYKDTIPQGEDRLIRILEVELGHCPIMVYFCAGFNYEHEEEKGDIVTVYKPYIYESPAEWDYMDGVELQHDGGKTLMDLHKAEENLYEHYTGSLTPITAISWSHRPEGKKTYEPITVEDEPQWIEAGSLALRLQFLCGETYSTSYVTDIDNVDTDATPVKRIENGRVIILRGGVRYDMLGNVIK